ncbi:MAG: zinc-binding dehydrogenase [Planctomycetes bacterium]|nr:zinc-binding dehydrogenase [Planctomycetota bacterium]
MTNSLAAVFQGDAGRISLQELPTPVPHGSEMLVRVVGCTLCGSDLHSFDGRRQVPVPTVLGHEIVGEIVAVGDSGPQHDLAGRELAIGDRVTWAIMAQCGRCGMCQRGLPQKCLHGVKYGHEAIRPGRELLGGLAEHCLLVSGTSIVRLPDELPLAVACPASCATATIAAAMEAAGDLSDRTVCVFGAGMLGLTACAMGRSLGASAVVCVDPIEVRRCRALQFGATHSTSPEDLLPVARDVVGDFGFDAILELSGNPGAFHAGWPLLRTGGTLVLVGSVFPGPPIPMALEQIVRRHLNIRGIHNYAPRHLLSAVDFLTGTSPHVPFADLVTAWYPLQSVADAFFRSADPGATRIGVATKVPAT